LDVQATEQEDLVLLNIVWRAHEGGSLLNVVDSRLLQTLQPSTFTPHQEDAIGPPPLPLDSNQGSYNNVVGNSIVLDVDVQVHINMVVDLLRLGLLCCLPNPKARPSMGQVNRILQQISDMENASTIAKFELISMPSLPATNPWRLYNSVEFSQTSPSLSSSSIPILEAHSKLLVDSSSLEQAFGNFHKDD